MPDYPIANTFQDNEKFSKYFFFCLSELKLPQIPVDFNPYRPTGFYGRNFVPENYKEWYININPKEIENIKILDTIFDYLKYPIESKDEKFFFVIAHETAHFFQRFYFSNWSFKRESDYEDLHMIPRFDYIASPEKVINKIGRLSQFVDIHAEYRKLRLEKNADRIAIILLKKFKERYLCYSQNELTAK